MVLSIVLHLDNWHNYGHWQSLHWICVLFSWCCHWTHQEINKGPYRRYRNMLRKTILRVKSPPAKSCWWEWVHGQAQHATAITSSIGLVHIHTCTHSACGSCRVLSKSSCHIGLWQQREHASLLTSLQGAVSEGSAASLLSRSQGWDCLSLCHYVPSQLSSDWWPSRPQGCAPEASAQYDIISKPRQRMRVSQASVYMFAQ